MKFSATATFALLLALPACGTEKDDTATDTMTGTVTNPDSMTDATAATDATDATAATDATDATDATTSEPTTGEPTTGEPTTGSAGISFATEVWAPIMLSQCGCHQAGASGGLLMGADADSAYASMIGVASSKGMNYVTPGDPANSYMFHKVDGTQGDVGGSGSQMPLGAPALDQTQIDAIEAWIADGASK